MKKTLTAVISGLLLASAMGYASADTAPATTAPAATVSAAPAPAKARPDLFAALAGTQVSLDDAIKTAEQTVTGGKLVKAELDISTTPTAYKVALADSSNRTVTYVKVDASTGKVLTSKVYRPDNRVAKVAAPSAAVPAKAAAPAKASTTSKTSGGLFGKKQSSSAPATSSTNPLKTPATTTPAQ